jgi:hypothetical protein
VAPSIPVAVAAATAAPTAAALPSTPATAAATPALFGPVAALAVDRTVPTGFEGHRGGLATTGTNHGCASAHAAAARAVTTLVLGMGRGVTAAAGTLFGLAARFTAPG